jgi:hypothetical protein
MKRPALFDEGLPSTKTVRPRTNVRTVRPRIAWPSWALKRLR